MTIKKLEGKERFEAHKLFVYCFHQRVDNIENEQPPISNIKEVNYDIIKINSDLKCKNDFSSKFNPNKTTNSIEELYYDFKSAELLNDKSLKELYKSSKEFLSNNKFSKFKNEKKVFLQLH